MRRLQLLERFRKRIRNRSLNFTLLLRSDSFIRYVKLALKVLSTRLPALVAVHSGREISLPRLKLTLECVDFNRTCQERNDDLHLATRVVISRSQEKSKAAECHATTAWGRNFER